VFCALATQEVPEDEGDAVQTQDNRGRKALVPERSRFITLPKGIKRERGIDEDAEDAQNAKRKKSVAFSDVPSGSNVESQLEGGFSGTEVNMGDAEPSFGDVLTSTNVQAHRVWRQRLTATPQEPLFFPVSQMTQADVEAFKAAGLGDGEDLEELLLDDSDDLENDLNGGGEIIVDNDSDGGIGGLEDLGQGGGDGTLMEATQIPLRDDHKGFRPFFDD